MRSSKIGVRYFPFAPGIPWKVKNGKYIIPELSAEAWKRALQDRDAVVVSYGGLIEAFASLSFLEIVNYTSPHTKLFWYGEKRFESLLYLNGLSQRCEGNVPKETFNNYPTPLFMDKDNHIYFNCLNNYIQVKPYYGIGGYKDKSPVLKQILQNSTLPWTNYYLPQLRNIHICENEIIQWARVAHFNLSQPYICIFPDVGLSQHKVSALKWNDSQVKALSAMLKQKGIGTLIFTNHSQKYYGAINCLPVRLDYILYLMPKAIAILSEEPDMLLIGGMMSSAKLISRPLRNELSLAKNIKFLGKENVIYTARSLIPSTVFNIIHGAT